MADTVDVSPELYKEIQADFRTSVANDKKLKSIVAGIRKGTATQADVRMYSALLGKHSSNALKHTLKLNVLPNSTMYWNIAQKTIAPLLLGNYASITSNATKQMSFADKAINIGINVVAGQNPMVRISQVMQFACNSKTQEELDNALTDPVLTANLKFYDDFLKENAAVREEMGLKQTVVRTYDDVGLHGGKDPCQWCIERAGTYDSYREAEEAGAFQRHPGCGCIIETFTEAGHHIQTDWTSNTWE